MRALGHPDVYLPTDLAIRRVLADLGGPVDPDPEALAAVAVLRTDAPLEHPDARHPCHRARTKGELTCGP